MFQIMIYWRIIRNHNTEISSLDFTQLTDKQIEIGILSAFVITAL